MIESLPHETLIDSSIAKLPFSKLGFPGCGILSKYAQSLLQEAGHSAVHVLWINIEYAEV